MATMTAPEVQAMQDYKDANGKHWKARLTQAWLNDYPEQRGILRTIRNNYAYTDGNGLDGIFVTFAKSVRAIPNMEAQAEIDHDNRLIPRN